MIDNPEEGAAIATVGGLELSHDCLGLTTTRIRTRTGAIRDTEAEDNLGRITAKHVVDKIVIVRQSCLRASAGTSKPVDCRPREAIVVLRHQKIKIGGIVLE